MAGSVFYSAASESTRAGRVMSRNARSARRVGVAMPDEDRLHLSRSVRQTMRGDTAAAPHGLVPVCSPPPQRGEEQNPRYTDFGRAVLPRRTIDGGLIATCGALRSNCCPDFRR